MTEHAAPRDGAALEELAATVRRLVGPGGCAWHAEQSHESLVRYLVEESAELAEAIETGQPAAEVRSELGDALYQVLFHAAIAERDAEGYDLSGVLTGLNAKLVARHPHVFGDRGPMTVAELDAEWERLKEDAAGQRRGSRGVLEGIPAAMPGLARAAKVVDRLARAEGREAAAALAAVGERAAAADAIGDQLLALVIRANAAGRDADRELRAALRRLAADGAPAPAAPAAEAGERPGRPAAD